MTLPSRDKKRWIRVDLHIHSPASEDYAEADVSFINILEEADRRGLELIAITDHNTVAGYEQLKREIEFLEQLDRTQRATPEDRQQLSDFQRLLSRITVLPGFEFTSHYGAHVLGVFAPSTPISLIEATLLQLGVPAPRLKAGTTGVPDTEHVTDAYELIARAGGLVIAAHANGPSGVISETLRLGTSGQARIAATQSAALHAIEFINFYSDHGTFTSPAFYNGKTEHYERPMFCIQGSDAHRVRRAPEGTDATHKHGIGDRYFEALLPEASFEALRALFTSSDFDHVRVPKRDQKQWEIDQLRFGYGSERHVLRAGSDELEVVVRDVAALSNAGGGMLVVGAGEQVGVQAPAVLRPQEWTAQLRAAVEQRLDPAPMLSFELLNYDGRDVVRVEVTATQLPPYVTREGVIFVRRNAETVPASRGEVVQLARRALAAGGTSPLDNGQDLEMPRSGVEIVDAQRKNGEWIYEIRDLRTTPGVGRDRAQGLWQYAIARHEDLRDGRLDVYSQVKWAGRLGLLRVYQQGGRTKYDLVHRDANGVIDHIFYGVSDWGLSESWSLLMADLRTKAGLPPMDDAAGSRANGSHSDTPEDEQPTSLADRPGAAMLPSVRPETDMLAPANGDVADTPHPSPATAGQADEAGNRRWRWRGRGGLLRIYAAGDGQPRFDLAMKRLDGQGADQFRAVPREKLSDAWLRLIRAPRPRTGIEVVFDGVGDDGVRRIAFRDLRNGEVSTPWRVDELKEGSVREYAARMNLADRTLDEDGVRWWGNLGYLRPMRSQVDLVFRDEDGVDHVFYAARREELRDEWAQLLAHWPDEPAAAEGRPRPAQHVEPQAYRAQPDTAAAQREEPAALPGRPGAS